MPAMDPAAVPRGCAAAMPGMREWSISPFGAPDVSPPDGAGDMPGMFEWSMPAIEPIAESVLRD